MSREELIKLDAREYKGLIPKGSEFLGAIMLAYGDKYFYRLPDGSYVYQYFSIGD